MKIADFDKALQAVTAFKAAHAELLRAKDCVVFRLEARIGGGENFFTVGDPNGVGLSATGSYGRLAGDLYAAAIAYYQFHYDLALKALCDLGIEVEE